MDILEEIDLLVLRNIDELLEMGSDLLVIVRLRILLNSTLCVIDALQVTIPVVQQDKAAENAEALVAVVGADTLHLV